MVTSPGIIFFSISSRTNSKSVSDAAGKPISISLKPMSQSSLNIRVLRSESIGSMSAWLPSRRSTAHQIGGLVITALGHLRSGRGTALKGTYFSAAFGIIGFWGLVLWGFWDDMTCSSSRRARPYGSNEHCDGLKRWRRLVG